MLNVASCCRLVTKACSRMFNQNVTDIGACVTPTTANFFSKCGFSLDKYNSVAMRLDRSSSAASLALETAATSRDAERMALSCKIERVEQALKQYTVLPA